MGEGEREVFVTRGGEGGGGCCAAATTTATTAATTAAAATHNIHGCSEMREPHSEEAGVDNPTAALGDVSGEFLAVLLKP